VSYVLAAGIQIESLAPTNLTATPRSDITGNEFVQVIYGNDGDNVLDGKGGADTMVGGNGNDTYYLDHANDAILSEGVGKGTNDRAFASGELHAGTVGADRDPRAHRSGRDHRAQPDRQRACPDAHRQCRRQHPQRQGRRRHMSGGAGNDWYYVDNPGDVVAARARARRSDRFFASANYARRAACRSRRSPPPTGGGTSDQPDRQRVRQALYGNEGNNILDGAGGADALYGGGGNDWYYVDNAGDVIGTEASARGTDRVFASVELHARRGLEIETLSPPSTAASIPQPHRQRVRQHIYGNAGNNVIDGKGGNDTLQGLGGQDIYAFTTALGAGNVDTITGFSVANDTIQLENAVFTGLAAGALAAGAFNTGAAATQADDRIIYNSATGALLFDAMAWAARRRCSSRRSRPGWR
jgi:Ca2+-binding RTX toxin-like protein